MRASSNPATDPKCPKCIYKISKNFRVEKSGEISRNLRFSRFFVPASFSDTHHVLTLRFRCKAFFELLHYEIDAPSKVRRYTYPLVLIGGESIRYLPAFQHHACNETYVVSAVSILGEDIFLEQSSVIFELCIQYEPKSD